MQLNLMLTIITNCQVAVILVNELLWLEGNLPDVVQRLHLHLHGRGFDRAEVLIHGVFIKHLAGAEFEITGPYSECLCVDVTSSC